MQAWTLDTGPGHARDTARRWPTGQTRPQGRRAPGPGHRVRRVSHGPAPRRGRSDRHAGPGSCLATRWSVGRRQPGRLPTGSPWATGWASPGSGRRAGRAGGAGPGARTCVHGRATPDGTTTAGTPSTPWCRPRSRTGSRKPLTTCTLHPCCAPGSSATARFGSRSCRPEEGLGSTASAAVRTSPLRSPSAQGAEVHVLTRGEQARTLAAELGAASVAGARDRPPGLLDAAIIFAPAGDLVPLALEALDQGGTLAVAGIHLSDIPALNYQRHLFRERTLRSVTSNTRQDGAELLNLAASLAVKVHPVPYAFEDAPQALADLRDGRHQRCSGPPGRQRRGRARTSPSVLLRPPRVHGVIRPDGSPPRRARGTDGEPGTMVTGHSASRATRSAVELSAL